MKIKIFFQNDAAQSRHVAFIWTLLNFTSVISLEEVRVKALEPDITQYNEVMLHNQTFFYSLKKLYPYMTYEVRISYPASVPTEFVIHVDVPYQLSSLKSRHLLNIDKSTFKTDSQTEGYVAKVVAHRIGFPYNPERHNDPVVFNIGLESLHFGLTRSSWKMLCYVLVLCAISFKYLAPAALRVIMSNETKCKHQC